MREITGSCLCGIVSYKVRDNFKKFFFCYCKQCRKMSGSAHAANLFASPKDLLLMNGEENTIRYQYPDRSFTKVFCSTCGTGVPYISGNGTLLIVPAGSLDEEPEKKPDAQIFCEERTEWYQEGIKSPQKKKYDN